MAELSVAVIMACHNRRETTLSCLDRLYRQVDQKHTGRPVVYLTDDGSTDGTADAIRKQYPAVNVLQGTGSLFWNGGMRLAWSEAMKIGYDFYIWLNDDTLLYPDALKRMLQTYLLLASQGNERHIIAGSVIDLTTKELTYGGMIRKSHWHTFKFITVSPGISVPKRCDTVNGNFVLIPHSVVQVNGNLELAFSHGLGDFDYALRAKANGCEVWIGPGYYGSCTRNNKTPIWQNPTSTLKKCLKEMNKSKVLPIKEWRLFTKRHAGILWPIFSLSPYFKLIVLYIYFRNFRRI
jgi:GT2 family glycosyltransferase